MSEMTSHERVSRIFEHREPDRVPIHESPWGATRERWQREGLPEGMDYVDYFGLDHFTQIGVDNSPRFPTRTIEETDEHRIIYSQWGATLKLWKHAASTPEFLDFTVTDRESWEAAKKRMTVDRDRVNWDRLKTEYPKWRERGDWLVAGGWFGFDVTHSWFIGTERMLMALVEDPDWCVDVWQTQLDLNLALLDMVWDAGYEFDAIRWPDDMGYKYSQFFSVDTYRELLKPIHKQAVDWAHAKGVKACLHSCGDIRPFIPELIDMGMDYLNPLEVKAGVDPVQVKQDYGDKLVLHGGISAPLWDKGVDAMVEHVREFVPRMKTGGGYVFATDHSTPSSVSLEGFKRVVETVKEVGRYD